MTIIGLGNTGCNIAEKFENINNIKVLLIDANIEGEENCISIKECKTPEEYENTFPDLTNQLKIVDNEVYLIIGGSGKISGSSLSLLKQLKDKELNIIYIKPDKNSINGQAKLQDRLVFNVMQEYARSGIFKNCLLIDNLNIEKILGDLPVIGYYEKINDLIFNSIKFILTYQNKTGIINNLMPIKNISRIRTLGIFDLIKEEENLFYDMKFIDSKHFYFVLNEESLKNDNTILKRIKEFMNDLSQDGSECSYSIFPTKEEIGYCFIDAYSKRIQE